MNHNRTHYFRASVLSEYINMKELAQKIGASHSTIDPLAAIMHPVEQGQIFIFRFGAVVFWNVPEQIQHRTLESLLDLPGRLLDTVCSEEFIGHEGVEKSRVEFNRILIDRITPERAEVIASSIAQSVAMEHFEGLCEQAWTQVDQMIASLKAKGKLWPSPQGVTKQVAHCLELRSRVVRVLHLLDRPDLIWEDPLMDEQYSDLRAIFDLDERFQALEYKLQLIQNSLELLVDTARDRRLYWVEMAIVLLILVEICISLYPK